MTRQLSIFLSVICIVVLSACASIPEPKIPPTETAVPGPAFTPDLIKALAAELKVQAEEIRLVSSESVEWRDSCLGVEREGLMCLQVIKPGYLMTFETPLGVYEAHTNKDGSAYIFVLQETGASVPEPKVLPPTETEVAGPDFTPDLITALAAELKVQAEEIRLVSSESVEWRNSCLGVEQEGVMCMEVITPGFLLTFETPQGIYEAHTNEDGSRYIFVAPEG